MPHGRAGCLALGGLGAGGASHSPPIQCIPLRQGPCKVLLAPGPPWAVPPLVPASRTKVTVNTRVNKCHGVGVVGLTNEEVGVPRGWALRAPRGPVQPGARLRQRKV